MDSAKDENIKDVKAFLEKIIKTSLETTAGQLLNKFYKKLDVNDLVNKVIVNQAPSITWNHGKVLAVNGTTLMTGGINYWDLYANNGPHDICDHAIKVQGDAAVSAHRWADYFWKYEIIYNALNISLKLTLVIWKRLSRSPPIIPHSGAKRTYQSRPRGNKEAQFRIASTSRRRLLKRNLRL